MKEILKDVAGLIALLAVAYMLMLILYGVYGG